jgi:hypothetical protein
VKRGPMLAIQLQGDPDFGAGASASRGRSVKGALAREWRPDAR